MGKGVENFCLFFETMKLLENLKKNYCSIYFGLCWGFISAGAFL